MKIHYDSETDTLTVLLRKGRITESDENKPGVTLDYDSKSHLVSLGILNASKQMDDPRTITWALQEAS